MTKPLERIAALAPEERIESIDVVRGIALFGVLAVNLVTEFRVSIFQQFLAAAPGASDFDRAVERAVFLGLEFKAFCLFALLFSVWSRSLYKRSGRLVHIRRHLRRLVLLPLAPVSRRH